MLLKRKAGTVQSFIELAHFDPESVSENLLKSAVAHPNDLLHASLARAWQPEKGMSIRTSVADLVQNIVVGLPATDD